MTSHKILVVGAGISGATAARLLAEKGATVVLIDKRDHIAGNCYDYTDKNGIMIHKYGSHIFHTNDPDVWSFVCQFADFNQYMHKVVALVDGIETHIPFNFNTLYDLFPTSLAKTLEQKLLSLFQYNTKVPILDFKNQSDEDLRFLADYIYEKIFLHYTEKQWGASPQDIDASITARIPVYLSKDDRYFQDKYQGIPLCGYTRFIENMLTHPNIEVRLKTPYNDNFGCFERILHTGSIDEFFNYEYGTLPYRSVSFKFEEHNCAYYQSNAFINFPCNYDFTRIHEYKYYLNDTSDKTVIAKEYPESFELGKNDRYYPIPRGDNIALHKRYLGKAAKIRHVHFFGRLGDYKYYDMDKAISRAFSLCKRI